MKNEMDNFERRDAITDNLMRLRGMLGAVLFLINPTGEKPTQQREDIEIWLRDIQERVEETIEMV